MYSPPPEAIAVSEPMSVGWSASAATRLKIMTAVAAAVETNSQPATRAARSRAVPPDKPRCWWVDSNGLPPIN